MRIFTDKQTGVRFDRKEFLAAIEYLNEGDILVVWSRCKIPTAHAALQSLKLQFVIVNFEFEISSR